MNNTLYWIAVAAVTIISSARLTRLAVYDDFPPVKWVRNKYQDRTDNTDWQLLALCGYCASFWITAFVVVTGYFADVYGPGDGNPERDGLFLAWWFLMGILSTSYLAAWFVANDGDDSEDES